MIDYIRSEIYRTTKTPMYRNFLLFALAVTTLSLIFWKGASNDEDYFNLLSLFGFAAIMAISSLALIITFKTKDTKVQILSYGIERHQMYFTDLITMQIITIITTVLLVLLGLGAAKLGSIFGIITVGNAYIEFITWSGQLLLYTLNVNNALFGLAYLFNNVALSLILNFAIIPMVLEMFGFMVKNEKIQEIAFTLLRLQPFEILKNSLGNQISKGLVENFLMSIGFVIVAYLITGFIRFRKQEIY